MLYYIILYYIIVYSVILLLLLLYHRGQPGRRHLAPGVASALRARLPPSHCTHHDRYYDQCDCHDFWNEYCDYSGYYQYDFVDSECRASPPDIIKALLAPGVATALRVQLLISYFKGGGHSFLQHVQVDSSLRADEGAEVACTTP